MNVIKLARYAIAGWLPCGKRHCVICGHAVWRFMPYGKGLASIPALMAALDVVGSDPDHFECPRCGAHDRERHLLMYLEATGLLAGMRGKSILHFAPEKRLTPRIQTVGPVHQKVHLSQLGGHLLGQRHAAVVRAHIQHMRPRKS